MGKAGAPYTRGTVRFVQSVPKEAGDNFALAMASLKEGRPKEGVEFLQKAIGVFS